MGMASTKKSARVSVLVSLSLLPARVSVLAVCLLCSGEWPQPGNRVLCFVAEAPTGKSCFVFSAPMDLKSNDIQEVHHSLHLSDNQERNVLAIANPFPTWL